MKASEVLDKAADVMEKNGWYRGENTPERKGDGQLYCPLTAIGSMFGGKSPFKGDPPAAKKAKNALALSIDPEKGLQTYASTIVWWNDTRKSKRLVIRRLRAVAKKLREKGD